MGKNTAQVAKAETSTNLSSDGSLTWIEPPQDMNGLLAMVQHSTILPQCIAAYRNNIAGFGIGVRYIEDVEETPEMRQEFEKLEAILDQLTLESDTKEVFEDIIEARECYGVAYLEVMRNVAGEVNQIEFITDTRTIRKSVPNVERVDTSFYYKGEAITRQKRFRTYKQEKNGKTVYFKEFGDKRKMDSTTGVFTEEIDTSKQANEILEFRTGDGDYGSVRWIGQCINVDGSRRAEGLNNNYFKKGRHTPLMVVVRGGGLTDDSYDSLQGYMNDIEGEKGQHGFLVLELEETSTKAGFEGSTQPDVEIKDLASVLQKDELFQEYLDNSRKKMQSSFRLPDLYVGYTTDFNRATAQTAQEVTEQQVFIPLRGSVAWIINNKLLNDYMFKHVEVYFKAPEITNPDDMAKLLAIAEKAGGITPNLAHEIALSTMGKTAEDYTEEWGDIPVVLSSTSTTKEPEAEDSTIEKSVGVSINDELVDVLRSVKTEIYLRGEN